MARQRMLHPDFFTDPKMVRCSMAARLLFQGLWCWSDREGRQEADPLALKMRILPGDAADVPKLLAELEREGLVQLYEGDNKRLVWLPGFKKRQRPHPKEPKSELPEPPPRPSPVPAVEKHGKTESKPSESFPSESESESLTTLSAGADAALCPPPLPAPTPEQLRDVWNTSAPPSLPRWKGLPEPRAKAAKARLREVPDLERWRNAIVGIASSKFHMGQNDRGWRAEPDWLLRPGTLTKLEEGGHGGSSDWRTHQDYEAPLL